MRGSPTAGGRGSFPGGGGSPATTVTEADPLAASAVAVMVAVPCARPRTSPEPSTLATATFELDHCTDTLGKALPAESRAVALS